VVNAEENPTLSPDEFDEQLRGLSKADTHRLKKIAWAYAAQCDLGPDELLQEAVTRALKGSRRCPRHIKVVPFLAQVMRSLRSDENKTQDRKPDILSFSGSPEAEFDPPDPSPTPEELWYSQQRVKELWDEIHAVFRDDELAIDILEYRTEGYEAEEIRKDLGLDQTTYDSKLRFIRRRIDRHFRQEERS